MYASVFDGQMTCIDLYVRSTIRNVDYHLVHSLESDFISGDRSLLYVLQEVEAYGFIHVYMGHSSAYNRAVNVCFLFETYLHIFVDKMNVYLKGFVSFFNLSLADHSRIIYFLRILFGRHHLFVVPGVDSTHSNKFHTHKPEYKHVLYQLFQTGQNN